MLAHLKMKILLLPFCSLPPNIAIGLLKKKKPRTGYNKF